jgi:hypothetical protein
MAFGLSAEPRAPLARRKQQIAYRRLSATFARRGTSPLSTAPRSEEAAALEAEALKLGECRKG